MPKKKRKTHKELESLIEDAVIVLLVLLAGQYIQGTAVNWLLVSITTLVIVFIKRYVSVLVKQIIKI